MESFDVMSNVWNSVQLAVTAVDNIVDHLFVVV